QRNIVSRACTGGLNDDFILSSPEYRIDRIRIQRQQFGDGRPGERWYYPLSAGCWDKTARLLLTRYPKQAGQVIDHAVGMMNYSAIHPWHHQFARAIQINMIDGWINCTRLRADCRDADGLCFGIKCQ